MPECRLRPRAPVQPFPDRVALPPRVGSRRFFARRCYPRARPLPCSRGAVFVDACLRARPRLRAPGTRLEWIRLALLWARRRLSTSATRYDAQAHPPSVPSSSVNQGSRGPCDRPLSRATPSRRPYAVPCGPALALAFELAPCRSTRWVPRKPTSHSHPPRLAPHPVEWAEGARAKDSLVTASAPPRTSLEHPGRQLRRVERAGDSTLVANELAEDPFPLPPREGRQLPSDRGAFRRFEIQPRGP